MYGSPLTTFEAFLGGFLTPSIWIFVLVGIIIAMVMKKGFKMLEENTKKSRKK
jgi:hypothetical protein